MVNVSYDLVVIGGGPGGSTVATLVAKQGHRVLLLEKERFPRHQIGESLLPATVHGICGLLGVTKELETAGFQRKRGGTFLWGTSAVPWTFAFSQVTGSPTGFAYQVERSKFDDLLLRNAARCGVEVREDAIVLEILFRDGRVWGVRHKDGSGATHETSAAFVVDAGGHQSTFYRLVGDRIFSKFFENVALYGYFWNGRRLPPPNTGNILCAAFGDGWFWYIPLSPTLTSVGVVVSKAAAAKIHEGYEQAFYGYVNRCPIIRDHLSNATRVTEGQYGKFRVRKDYSYSNTALYKDGLVLIGDAACFVDPVFSSGVHLATYAGLLAARSINTSLDGQLSINSCFREFELRYRREFGNFYRFLAAFYDMHHNENSYFWAARKTLNSQEGPDHAFVRLVAGLSEIEEPVFPKTVCSIPEFRRMGDWFDQDMAGGGAEAGPGKPYFSRDVKGFGFDAYMPGLSDEIMQIQLQAALGSVRPLEQPIGLGGLIPSRGGYHWVLPGAQHPAGG